MLKYSHEGCLRDDVSAKKGKKGEKSEIDSTKGGTNKPIL